MAIDDTLYDAEELRRVTAWRMSLINDLGEDLRRCIAFMFPNEDAMLCLMETVRKLNAPAWVQSGMLIYWNYMQERLAADQPRDKLPTPEGEPCTDQILP